MASVKNVPGLLENGVMAQENPIVGGACCAAGHRCVERQRKVVRLGENQYFLESWYKHPNL